MKSERGGGGGGGRPLRISSLMYYFFGMSCWEMEKTKNFPFILLSGV